MANVVITMNQEQAKHILDMATCPNCGLEASRLEHRFCTHDDCTVLAAIAVLKQGTKGS